MLSEKIIQSMIDAWNLTEAETSLQPANAINLAVNEYSRLYQHLIQFKTYQEQITATQALKANVPQIALKHIRNLPKNVQGTFPGYIIIVKSFEDSVNQIVQAEAIRLLNKAEDFASKAQSWEKAKVQIEIAKKIYTKWGIDNDISERLTNIIGNIEKGQKAQNLLLQLELSINDGNYASANKLYNDIKILGNVDKDELIPIDEKLNRLRRHAEKRSSQQEFKNEMENVRAALRSVVGSEDWRSSYNCQRRLIELLAVENENNAIIKIESDLLLKYEKKFIEHEHQTINMLLNDIVQDLSENRLAVARRHLSAIDQILSDHTIAFPGELPDLTPPISLDDDQKIKKKDVEDRLAEKDERLKDALEKFDEALSYYQQNTIESLTLALLRLKLVNLEGQQVDRVNILQQMIQIRLEEYRKIDLEFSERRFDYASSIGNIEQAGYWAEYLRSIDSQSIINDKFIIIKTKKEKADEEFGAFLSMFDRVQDTADVSCKKELNQLLQKWYEVDPAKYLPRYYKYIVDKYIEECESKDLANLIQTIHDAIEKNEDLEKFKERAEILERSALGQRSAIREILARYYFNLAKRHEEITYQRDCLRKAQLLLEKVNTSTLVNQINAELEIVLSRITDGSRIASAERLLQEFLDNKDYESALQLVNGWKNEVPKHPALSDDTLVQKIIKINHYYDKNIANDFYQKARAEFANRNYAEALDFLDKSLDTFFLNEANSLKAEIGLQQAWESNIKSIFDKALKIKIADLALVSQDNVLDLEQAMELENRLEDNVLSEDMVRLRKKVKKHVETWNSNVINRIDEVRDSILDLADNNSFLEADNLISQLNNLGIPFEKMGIIIEIKRGLNEAKSQAERIKTQILEASEYIKTGNYSRAIQDLNISNVSSFYRNKISSVQREWERESDIYNNIKNSIYDPSNSRYQIKTLEEQLSNPQNAITAAQVNVLYTRFNTFVQQLKELSIPEEHFIRGDLNYLFKLTSFLKESLVLSGKTQTSVPEINKQYEGYTSHINRIDSELIPPQNLAQLTLSINCWRNWLEKRKENSEEILKSARAYEGQSFFFNIMNPLSRAREIVTSINGEISTNEQRQIDDLKKKIEKKEKNQFFFTGLSIIFIVVIVLLFYKLVVDPIINPPPPPPTLTYTPSPIPPSLTPSMTLPATLTPTVTPTITLTPTVTPVPVLGQSNYGGNTIYKYPKSTSQNLATIPLDKKFIIWGWCLNSDNRIWLYVNSVQTGWLAIDESFIPVVLPDVVDSEVLIREKGIKALLPLSLQKFCPDTGTLTRLFRSGDPKHL